MSEVQSSPGLWCQVRVWAAYALAAVHALRCDAGTRGVGGLGLLWAAAGSAGGQAVVVLPCRRLPALDAFLPRPAVSASVMSGGFLLFGIGISVNSYSCL